MILHDAWLLWVAAPVTVATVTAGVSYVKQVFENGDATREGTT